MNFSINRDTLLELLSIVIGVVERRQTMPILANVLLQMEGDQLSATATDLEVELIASTPLLGVQGDGKITVPGRKLFDICKSLPADTDVNMSLQGDKVKVACGSSKFELQTLPAEDFPVVGDLPESQSIKVNQTQFKRMLDKVHFCMAQQDVRFYLNGMLLETTGNRLRGVATDGHRLALCDVELVESSENVREIIVPRKGILELQRLLDVRDLDLQLEISTNHIAVRMDGLRYTSKLIDGVFPDYQGVFPSAANYVIKGDPQTLKGALQRVAILANERSKGVSVTVADNEIVISAQNAEHEQAEERVPAQCAGGNAEVGFNVSYLIDALNALEGEVFELNMADIGGSCLVKDEGEDNSSRYIVMPMRL